MSEIAHTHPICLFTLRLWEESLGDNRSEWRAEIRHLQTGDVRFFRRWDELEVIVDEMMLRASDALSDTE